MRRFPAFALPVSLLIASFAVLYRNVVPSMVHDWATDDNYSHGFLIVPLALYLAWERRDRLAGQTPRPTLLGLVLIAASLVVLAAGTLGAERFLARISMLGVIAGTILFLYGRPYLRVLAFPLGILILMIPLPALVFNQIAFPLQLLASRAGTLALMTLGVPVLREGNVIVLAHTTLEVAEACSGIRSLVSLITLATVYAYFIDTRPGVRAAIALSAIPVAIIANGVRVAGTGAIAQYWGAEAAEGFFHTFSGWLVFIVAFASLFALRRVLVAAVGLPAPERMTEATV